MNLFFKSLLVFSFLLPFGCQEQNDFTVAQTYDEPQDPTPSTDQNWSEVPNGLHASVTTTDIRFVRSEIPEVNMQSTWEGTSWKGERTSAQLVLWSNDSITEVNTKMSDFKSDSGETLPSTIADISFVKYVITDEFSGGCGYRQPENFASSLAADILEPVTSYAVKAQETRPIWVTIDIPSDAKIGIKNHSILYPRYRSGITSGYRLELPFGSMAESLCRCTVPRCRTLVAPTLGSTETGHETSCGCRTKSNYRILKQKTLGRSNL